jgi:formyl-CoA transferase
MFESSVSWLTVPITISELMGKKISRRGNTHEFFCPVSVYRTSNGFVYVAVGNDRQWKAMVALELFKPLDKPVYEKNAGRIADVESLNQSINAITQKHTSEVLIDIFNSINVPISKIKTIPEVVEDPLVQRRLLRAQDSKTGTKLTLAPLPVMTSFIENADRKLAFPPRFGEHNQEIYGKLLGYSQPELAALAEKKVI